MTMKITGYYLQGNNITSSVRNCQIFGLKPITSTNKLRLQQFQLMDNQVLKLEITFLSIIDLSPAFTITTSKQYSACSSLHNLI